MESNKKNDGQLIVEEYLHGIQTLLKKEDSWWIAASKWNDSEYGKTINTSVQIAEEIVYKYREDSGLEKEYNKFFQAVVQVYNLTLSVDKNSMMIGKIISAAGNSNSEITTIALAALNRLKKFIETEYPDSKENWSIKPIGFRSLKPGSTGTSVKELQGALSKLLYYRSLIDGVFGPETSASVSKFQSDNSLEPTGIADERTYNTIQSALSRLIQDHPGYWLLKINPATWDIAGFVAGQEAWFHTYNLNQQRRVEYDLFFRIKTGDKIIGYAFENINSVVCLFEVKETVHSDPSLGEGIVLNIARVLQQFKPLSFFSEKIPFLDQLGVSSPFRLFEIDRELYIEIIESSDKSSGDENFRYMPFINTEGNHGSTDDMLEFMNDIESLAKVISLEDVIPPLAIGLFGFWGSGKSFFMEKLNQKIDEYSKMKSEGYVKNVVQVKFNSWHYSDGSLWPSLITEIFDSLSRYSKKEGKENELKKLTESLQLTGAQKEIIEKKRRDLQLDINKLKEEQKTKRDRLEDLSGIGLIKLILSDKKIREDFSELNNKNIEKIIQETEKLNEYASEIKGWGNLFNYYMREFVNLKGWRWIVPAVIVLLIPVIVLVIKQFYPVEWSGITFWISVKYSLITVLVGNFLRPLRAVLKSYFQVLERLDSMKNTINARKMADPPELADKEKILDDLNASLYQINDKIEEAQNEISDILSGKQLLNFLEQRSRDERYANQLGLISWIRKDFCMLDELLRKQHNLSSEEKSKLINPKDVQLQIDRIVLHIDDLDRCKEDIVVKVLEAIHLLLAFPLFVVVVGVDPRWLNNALTAKYGNLFGSDNSKTGKDKDLPQPELFLSTAATSYDYLEKIFQIPFSLKKINVSGRENLIRYLLRNEMKDGLASNVQHTVSQHSAANSSEEKTNVGSGTDLTLNESGNQSLTNEPVKDEKIKKLTFKQEELEFMQKASLLFGQTPRMINRYVNIYRIIKSHRSLKIVGRYSEDEFIPVMIVLGVVVGYPCFAQKFMEELSAAETGTRFTEFILNSGIPDSLKTAIKSIKHDIMDSMIMEPFKRNLELISRFSFRTIMSS